MQENLLIIPTLTCGLIIRSPSGWLLAHRTGSAWWDLSKGKQDPGEAPLQTAMRECFEEAGLDLSSYRLRCHDLGYALYNPARQKSLQLFNCIYWTFPFRPRCRSSGAALLSCATAGRFRKWIRSHGWPKIVFGTTYAPPVPAFAGPPDPFGESRPHRLGGCPAPGFHRTYQVV